MPKSNASTGSTASYISRITSTVNLRRYVTVDLNLNRTRISVTFFNFIFMAISYSLLLIVHYNFEEAIESDCYSLSKEKTYDERGSYVCSGIKYLFDNDSKIKFLFISFETALFIQMIAFIFGIYGAVFLNVLIINIYIALFTLSTSVMIITYMVEQVIGDKGPFDYLKIAPWFFGVLIAILSFEIIVFIQTICLLFRYLNIASLINK